MPAEIPSILAPLFAQYSRLLDEYVPGLVQAFYFHGSICLDAFNPKTSDIDFLAVTSRRPTQQDISKLDALHHKLNKKNPFARKLEGHYALLEDLRDNRSAKHCAVNRGRIKEPSRVPFVTFYLVKHRGITLFGPPSGTFPVDVRWLDILREMDYNLNEYWTGAKKRRLLGIPWLFADWFFAFAVLTLCRILYTIEQQSIVSKKAAGEWGLGQERLSPWHHLIIEALRIQSGKRTPLSGRLQRIRETRAFIDYIVDVNRGNLGRRSDEEGVEK